MTPDTGRTRTVVVNLRREPYDVYIGRAGNGEDGYYGNPVVAGAPCPVCGDLHGTPGATLPCFALYFKQSIETDPAYRARVEMLAGKRLGCFCYPRPCHGNVIAEYLNRDLPRVQVLEVPPGDPLAGFRFD